MWLRLRLKLLSVSCEVILTLTQTEAMPHLTLTQTQMEASLCLTWCYSDSYSEWNSSQPHLVLLRLILRLNLVRSYRVSDFTCRRRTITQIEELIKISVTFDFLSLSCRSRPWTSKTLGLWVSLSFTSKQFLRKLVLLVESLKPLFGTWNSKPIAISLCALSPEAWWIPQTHLWVQHLPTSLPLHIATRPFRTYFSSRGSKWVLLERSNTLTEIDTILTGP